jgi:hypothetical protein
MTDKKTTGNVVKLKCGNATTGTPAIYGAMSAIMAEIGAIGKDSNNKSQGFKFRGIDAAYNAIHPLMCKHSVFTVPRVLDLMARKERETRNGGVLAFTLLRMEYDFISGIDGSKITVGPIIGEGMDGGDKGTNKAMAIAHKYALFQTFLIPTEGSADPDFDSHEVRPESAHATHVDVVLKPPPTKPSTADAANTTAAAESLTIETEADAEMIAADIMRSGTLNQQSKEALSEVWKKNSRPIRILRESFTDQYVKLENHFKTISTNASQGA